MPSFFHTKLVEQIRRLDTRPAAAADARHWSKAEAHTNFLQQNALSDELILHASGPHTFVHSVLGPNTALNAVPKDDLLTWSSDPFNRIANYVSGGGRVEMWIERGNSKGTGAPEQGMDLVFARQFHGLTGAKRYFEVNQEFTHLTDLHWRPEERGYCRFDENGDLLHSVSITVSPDDVDLVSFHWPDLETYLPISKSSLVQMFDFTMIEYENFTDWPKVPQKTYWKNNVFGYRQIYAQNCASTRGVQIISPRRHTSEVHRDITDGWFGKKNRGYVEFIIFDWRNNCITKASTDPNATTNYFEAAGNQKPFELSPAFFRPEVLTKYKMDREKYTIRDRDISCRSTWNLRGYDVNEAGQVHVYLCDLRRLPHSEQLHWLSYNEPPKASISERAIANDFKGEWVKFVDSRNELIQLLRQLHKQQVKWWKIRNLELFDRANTPLASSKDEWSEAILDLSKLVIEGLELTVIRRHLKGLGVSYDEKSQSISLLESVLNIGQADVQKISLSGMREVQRIRSKVKGHEGGSESQEIVEGVKENHGSFKNHFEFICNQLAEEIKLISVNLS